MTHDELYRTASITKQAMVDAAVKLIERGRATYKVIADNTGVPWYIIGAIHYREASCNFGRSIKDGHRITTNEWMHDAIHTINGFYWRKPDNDEVTVADEAEFCERWNGIGYRRMGVPSPYLWSGTQHYKGGKYSSDGHYDRDLMDEQAGCMAIRRTMLTPTTLKVIRGADPLAALSDAAGATTSESPSRPITLGDAVDVTARLGKLPAPHEIGLSQLESHWRLLTQMGDNMASLQQETREALENGMPRYILMAARKRMLDRAVEAGIHDVNIAHGYYRRVFHGEPHDAGDVRQLVNWWMFEVRR